MHAEFCRTFVIYSLHRHIDKRHILHNHSLHFDFHIRKHYAFHFVILASFAKILQNPVHRAVKFIICQWVEIPSITRVAKKKLSLESSVHIICARHKCRKQIWSVVAMLCRKTWQENIFINFAALCAAANFLKCATLGCKINSFQGYVYSF